MEMTTNHTLKRLCQCWGSFFVIHTWLSSAVSSGCASNFFCLAYIMSRESFLHFALIDYDVKFQLPRHRMTLSQSWTKGSDLKLFSKTFLAFKSPFHQDFLATSRITFLAVNSQKVVHLVVPWKEPSCKERKEWGPPLDCHFFPLGRFSIGLGLDHLLSLINKWVFLLETIYKWQSSCTFLIFSIALILDQ